MAKKKIIIAGCGFAGSNALKRFGKLRKLWSRDFEVLVFDPKENLEFLPMLPDVLSGKVSPGAISYPIKELCRKYGCVFVRSAVTSIDTVSRKVCSGEGVLEYEYLLLSPGSQTNFYGNEKMEKACFKMDSVSDALSVRKEILSRSSSGREVRVLVIGGGYTGIETASACVSLLKKTGTRHKVMISEMSRDILPSLPEWIRVFARGELEKMSVEVFPEESLKDIISGKAIMASGREIDDVMPVWTAGVRTPMFLESFSSPKFRTRLNVDSKMCLETFSEGKIFASGDAAAFYPYPGGEPARMSVVSAINQGKAAAEGILRLAASRPASAYRHYDPGYVVPFYNGKAPGMSMGMKVPPVIGYFLHYFMCVYRAPFRGKIRIIRDIISKRR